MSAGDLCAPHVFANCRSSHRHSCAHLHSSHPRRDQPLVNQLATMAPGLGEIGTPLYSPVSESLYPLLAVLLLSIGLLLTASFFIYEVTSTKLSRSLVQEFATGGLASVFMGFGTLFLLLWTGVYV